MAGLYFPYVELLYVFEMVSYITLADLAPFNMLVQVLACHPNMIVIALSTY